MAGIVNYLRNAVRKELKSKSAEEKTVEERHQSESSKPNRHSASEDLLQPQMKTPRYVLRQCHRNEYLVGPSIGQGSFATVHIGREQSTGKDVAIKIVKSRQEIERVDASGVYPEEAYNDVLKAMKLEAQYIAGLGVHPNIIRILGVAEDCAVIVMEKAITDLFSLLRKQVSLSFPVIRCWAKDVLTAIDYMHQNRLVHQDIKSSNVLIFSDHAAKVCDFGLARPLDDAMPVDRELVTLWYRPPELLMGASHYSPRVDEWGAGCVVLEMLTGSAPFRGKPGFECACSEVTHHNFNSDQLRKIFALVGTPCDPSFLSGMACCAHFCSWPVYPRMLEKQISRACEARRGPPPYDDMPAGGAGPADFATLVAEWRALTAGLLHLDPAQRITARHALRSPLFSEPSPPTPRSHCAQSDAHCDAGAARCGSADAVGDNGRGTNTGVNSVGGRHSAAAGGEGMLGGTGIYTGPAAAELAGALGPATRAAVGRGGDVPRAAEGRGSDRRSAAERSGLKLKSLPLSSPVGGT